MRPDPAFDVIAIADVDAVTVCQYDRAVGDGPALMASRRLTGARADAVLAGIVSAPRGGGPDRPSTCVDDEFGRHALLVRLHHDGRADDLHVYYDWCFGNGVDDGTTRYALTADNCAVLFGGGVIPWSFSSHLRTRCGPQVTR